MRLYFLFFLFFFIAGCTSSPQGTKGEDFTLIYHRKKDSVTIRAKNQPLADLLRVFKDKTKYEIFFKAEKLKKKISIHLKNVPVHKALEAMVEKAGLILARARTQVGYVIRTPWKVPVLSSEELSQKIRVAQKNSEIGKLLYISQSRQFQSLSAAKREKEFTADIFYAYRPVMQKLLWKKIPYLKKKKFHLPLKLKRAQALRVYYDPNQSEILAEALFLVNITHKVHIIFRYEFQSLQLKEIVLFVTATQSLLDKEDKSNPPNGSKE